ncbi:MAG: prepilin-type N-terminal cleavage/methylation domain-containing protein [[Eubacterium] siraeum]|nr:prepilin-type N-terminal cleavage/methylation domain-containing protein [[Eubacterium] siraeum]
MKNGKKYLCGKQGFTLVECIVAMAVLVISSLLLAMIMSVTVMQRNKNMELEREMDQQVELLNGGGAGGETPVVNPVAGSITFDDGSNGSVIPGNGSSGVVANQKYYDSENVRISNFNYNFTAYNTPKAGGSTGTPGSSGDPSDATLEYGSPMVSGGANIGTNITVTETALSGNKRRWTVSFKCNSELEEDSFKIQLPAGAKIDLTSSSATGCFNEGRIDMLKDNVVRVCPGKGDITLNIVFEQDSATNLSEHFGCGGEGSNSIQFPFVSSGKLPNTSGGSSSGGSSTEGGNTAGGNTEGGNTEGGNTEGGNTAGGSTEGGNTAGGGTDQGGSTENENG